MDNRELDGKIPFKSKETAMVLSTVGISLLFNHLVETSNQKEYRELLNRLANAQEINTKEETIISEILAKAKETLENDTSKIIRRKSAELNGIYAFYEDQIDRGTSDFHWLVTTDTVLGKRCAELVKAHLQRHNIPVDIFIPEGLTTASTTAFEKGIKNLIHWCDQYIPSFEHQTVVFNLVAAFKALQGYLNIIGMFYADSILYLFDDKDAVPILIPRLPIKVDIEPLQHYAVDLVMMAHGPVFIDPARIQNLSRTLYDQDESGNAMLSDWGTLTWQKVRSELLGDKLLSFPRITYQDSFKRDFDRSGIKERVELQSTLAEIANILVKQNGNIASLKSHPSILYSNLKGKFFKQTPIGHFRVSLNLRVSCLAKDESLLLRHFGQHDYVNNNP